MRLQLRSCPHNNVFEETELISSLSSVATLLMPLPVKPKYCKCTGLACMSTEQAVVKKKRRFSQQLDVDVKR